MFLVSSAKTHSRILAVGRVTQGRPVSPRTWCLQPSQALQDPSLALLALLCVGLRLPLPPHHLHHESSHLHHESSSVRVRASPAKAVPALADAPDTEVIQHLKKKFRKILYHSILAGSLALATFREQTTAATKMYQPVTVPLVMGKGRDSMGTSNAPSKAAWDRGDSSVSTADDPCR